MKFLTLKTLEGHSVTFNPHCVAKVLRVWEPCDADTPGAQLRRRLYSEDPDAPAKYIRIASDRVRIVWTMPENSPTIFLIEAAGFRHFIDRLQEACNAS